MKINHDVDDFRHKTHSGLNPRPVISGVPDWRPICRGQGFQTRVGEIGTGRAIVDENPDRMKSKKA
jgi:hypothetical protein